MIFFLNSIINIESKEMMTLQFSILLKADKLSLTKRSTTVSVDWFVIQAQLNTDIIAYLEIQANSRNSGTCMIGDVVISCSGVIIEYFKGKLEKFANRNSFLSL